MLSKQHSAGLNRDKTSSSCRLSDNRVKKNSGRLTAWWHAQRLWRFLNRLKLFGAAKLKCAFHLRSVSMTREKMKRIFVGKSNTWCKCKDPNHLLRFTQSIQKKSLTNITKLLIFMAWEHTLCVKDHIGIAIKEKKELKMNDAVQTNTNCMKKVYTRTQKMDALKFVFNVIVKILFLFFPSFIFHLLQ